jgi:hypothetical protein
MGLITIKLGLQQTSKGKVVIVFKHRAVKTYGRVKLKFYALTSTLDRSKLPASRPGRFFPIQEIPSTHRIGG